MADRNLDDSQWELSKENIQPVKQGRKASILTNALSEAQQSKLNAERHEFEKELRAYTGDDPLDVWYRYVVWVEQNYPQGGIKSNLVKLIESCFTLLCTKKEFEEKYNNDERFLDLWIKYANLTPCPLEIYQTLFKKNMFTELANFYQIWSWELEKFGNFKKANAIYLEGTQRKAKSEENLKIAYNKFLARFAHMSLEGMNSTENENSETEAQRQVFSKLRAKGLKAKAPIERVATIIGSAGRISSADVPKSNAMGPTYQIFQDENAPNVLTEANPVANSTSGKHFISHSVSSKENEKNSSVWTKNKIRQTNTQKICLEDVARINAPNFQVHSDPTSNDSCTTPVNQTEFSGVLSERKIDKDDWKVPLFVAEPFNPNAQPQYCKHLVYCGNEEFSFEELRALDVKKEEAKRKEEEEKRKEEEMRSLVKDEEIKELRERLKRHEEMIASLLQKQKSSNDSPEEKRESEEIVRSNTSSSQPTILVTDSENRTVTEYGSKSLRKSMQPTSHKRLYNDSWVSINKSMSFAANLTHNVSHIHDESSTKLLLTLKPAIPNNKANVSLSAANQTGNVSGSPPSNNTTGSKDHLRSPTVNTKFANNVVHGFFNETLFNSCDKNETSVDIPKSNEDPNEFQIYQDNTPVIDSNNENLDLLPVCENDDLASFPIYNDENKEVESLPQFHVNDVNDKYECSPSFPIYCDENEEQTKVSEAAQEKFSIYCDENEAPKVTEAKQEKFSIYCDENENEESKTTQQKFSIYCDASTKVLLNISKQNEIASSNDENQENIPPPEYQVPREKRAVLEVLKPSKDIPFISLEEQKKAEEDEGLEGIEPLPESCMARDDITMKMPLNSEAFAKTGFVASTPAPWSFGFVPQVNQDDDDFTMAMPIKGNVRKSILPDISVIQNIEDDRESLEKSDKSPASSRSIDKSTEKSGELMPPPPKTEPELMSRIELHSVETPMNKKHLSPILEASREYRSSTSSSSGSCSAFSTNSNLHGAVGSVSRSINFSHIKTVSYGEHEPYGIMSYNETKSGYVADKSRGESMTDISRKRKKSEVIEEEDENFNTSFDPNQIASLILSTADPLADNNKNKISVDREEKNSLGSSSEDLPQPNSYSPLSARIEYPPTIDPFNDVLQETLLKNLKIPVNERGGFVAMSSKMPAIKPRSKISLSKEMYNVKRNIGSGAYAQVFHSSTINPMNVTIAVNDVYDDDDENESDESQMILKVQKPACFWEFYICHELRERLKNANAPEWILNSFMRINRGYFFAQGSILVSQYHKTGTLLDLINKHKTVGKSIPENIIFFLMSELISVLISLHSRNIIHGDLKPDNVLMLDLPDSRNLDADNKTEILKLIDFGRSIDMSLYPQGTTFTKKVTTDGFTCCEMQENKPWTFQTDLYGLASIAHCMLWGTYMNVKKTGSVWNISGVNYYRYMKKSFWQNFFHKMINIPSCEELPDMKEVLKEFEQELESFDCELKRLKSLLGQR